MVFNWFRRKFDDEKDEKDQPVESAPTESVPEAAPIDDNSPIASPASQVLNPDLSIDLLRAAETAGLNASAPPSRRCLTAG